MTPHLLLPHPLDAGTLSVLAPLAARGRHRRIPAESADAWLCRAFGLAGAAGAPLALLGEGGAPAEAVWLFAAPVHFAVERQGLRVLDGRHFTLAHEEADALLASLDAHFAADGWHFTRRANPKRWYLRAALPAPATRALDTVAGRLAPSSPFVGEAARAWHRLASEAQMLLHAHPLNAAREARGELPINGLWLWGGGTLPARATSPFDAVYAHDPLARGLARQAGLDARPVPQGPEGLTGHAPLVVLDGPARLSVWQDGRRAAQSLYLPQRGVCIETRRGDRWKFWRRHALPDFPED